MSSSELYIKEANIWSDRAEEHLRLADYCQARAEELLGYLAVSDDYKPTLVLLEGNS